MIDLCTAGEILYISSVDISVGDGPGVNEREFMLALRQSIQGRAHFLIPEPREDLPDLPRSVCTFSTPHQRHSMARFPGHVLSTIRLADQLLAERSFDLLVFRLDLLPFAPLYITRTQRVPYALKTLGQGQMNALSENWGGLLGSGLAKVNQILVKKLVHGAIAVDTVSELQRHYLEQVLGAQPDKILCIDNAVNTHRFYPLPTLQTRRELGLERFDPIIGYIGNHAAHERGGTQLINVLPKLLPKFPSLGVVILGDVSGPHNPVDLARELGVTDHCTFTGYVPFHQVAMYVNALNVGISLLAPKFHGQSELKVRQYLACGKPVIATTPGSNDFLAQEELGSLVPYDDLSAFAQELETWLSLTPAEQTTFSQRAFQFAQDHLSVERSLALRMNIWNERLAMDPTRSTGGYQYGHMG